MPASRGRRRRTGPRSIGGSLGLIAGVLVVLGVLVVGVRYLWGGTGLSVASNDCLVGNYDLDTSQAQVASTMVSVVIKRGLPERAAVLTLAAALQESKLTNIPAGQGDRDSVGVLQQRPSQGWGTAAQIADVRYATGKFLDALVKVSGWQTGTLAEVIQAVQISADGTAYAQHESEAQQLADTFTGKTAAGVACSFSTPSTVATPDQVASVLRTELPVNTPITSATTVSVPGAGWATAAWMVAQADRFGIDSVAYDGMRWQRSKGWKSDGTATKAVVTATMAT